MKSSFSVAHKNLKSHRLTLQLRNFFFSRLSPFRHKSYRLFFVAQSLSLIGSMANELARAYLIVTMMSKASSLGIVLLASALPGIYFIPRGGVLVDRQDVRKIMMGTKAFLAVFSLALAFLVEFGEIHYWHLLLYAFLEACVLGFDGPAFQALNVRLIPKEDFQQAIALNSTNFHAGRMIGPLIAGALMAFYGPSLVFFVDGMTFLALVFVLSRLDLRPTKSVVDKIKQSSFRSFFMSLKHVTKDVRIRYSLIQLCFTWCFLVPLMMVVFRTYFAKKFDLDGEGFGFLFMFPAVGSLLGALSFAGIKPRFPLKMLRIGIPLAFFAVIGLVFVDDQKWAAVTMAIMGYATYLSLASLTVSSQLAVEEHFRGRLSAVINFGFLVIAPLLGFPVGYLADLIGPQWTMFSLASLFLVFSSFWALKHQHVYSMTPIDNIPLEELGESADHLTTTIQPLTTNDFDPSNKSDTPQKSDTSLRPHV